MTLQATSPWPKRKRSVPPTQDEFLALCLVMLSKSAGPTSSNPSPPPLELSYKCSVCNKTFPSYQALGGHKSSHRRPTPLDLARRVPHPSLSSGSMSTDASGGPHRCTICHRGFATGQALGGHKRCHYWDTSSSSGSLGSTVRDFDLNLPAQPEFEWVEEGEEVMSPLAVKKLSVCS